MVSLTLTCTEQNKLMQGTCSGLDAMSRLVRFATSSISLSTGCSSPCSSSELMGCTVSAKNGQCRSLPAACPQYVGLQTAMSGPDRLLAPPRPSFASSRSRPCATDRDRARALVPADLCQQPAAGSHYPACLPWVPTDGLVAMWSLQGDCGRKQVRIPSGVRFRKLREDLTPLSRR